MTQQGIKVSAGQTAVIGGQTVRFTTASPSMMASGNQVRNNYNLKSVFFVFKMETMQL